MNREMKFRGKGMQTGKWREGLLITNKLGYYIVTELNPHECTRYGYLEIDEYERVHPESVGQYTGLEDKNGNYIYEGDFIRYFSEVISKKEWICSIEVIGATFAVRTGEKSYMDGSFLNRLSKDEKLEIIGNVYENPELLEVTE